MSLALRAAVAWLILFAIMFANGTARVLVLQPRLGEDRARQVASLAGVVLVLAVSAAFVRLTPAATPAQCLAVGLGWGLATLAFEFLFGRFGSGLSWSALLADYNLANGRLWPLVVLSTFLGPWLSRAVLARSP